MFQTEEYTKLLLQYGLTVVSEVRSWISQLLSTGEFTAEEILEHVQDCYESDMKTSELSELVGQLLSVPYHLPGALAAVYELRGGQVYYCPAGKMNRIIRSHQANKEFGEAAKYIARQVRAGSLSHRQV